MRLMRFLLAMMLMLSMMLTAEAKTPEEFAAERNGYAALKSFFEAPKSKADCVSQTQVILHSPYIHGEFRSRGLERPKQKLEVDKGSINVNVTAAGDALNFDLPFYLVMNANALSIYFNWEDSWKKLVFNDVNFSTLDDGANAARMVLVERAVLLDDTSGQQIVRASFGCQRIADVIGAVTPEVQPDADKGKKSDVLAKCLNDALIQTETIDAVFTINKETAQPLMIELDLSNFVMNALNALATQEDVVKSGASKILSGLASTTRLQLFMFYDYSGNFNEKEFELPKKVRKAEDITNDLLSMVKTESTKTR